MARTATAATHATSRWAARAEPASTVKVETVPDAVGACNAIVLGVRSVVYKYRTCIQALCWFLLKICVSMTESLNQSLVLNLSFRLQETFAFSAKPSVDASIDSACAVRTVDFSIDMT